MPNLATKQLALFLVIVAFLSASSNPTISKDVCSEISDYAILNISYYSDEFIWRSEKARYGEGKIFDVKGKLVHITSVDDVHDHTACSKNLLGTKDKELPLVPWVALVKRGSCNFEEKVAHVYKYKATGIIVYNDRDSLDLIKMKIIDKEREIVAVSTYKWVGEDFAKVVENDIDVTVTITPRDIVTLEIS